ncbi:C-type mannose receptor 2-like [Arctopsyche grandis]|uniref:C-type mannose receptor 2-like n=1 Tax=Arctopsyche grandis TaxID=121162 RepID=UPI00406D8FE6
MFKITVLFLLIAGTTLVQATEDNYVYYPEVNIHYKFHKKPLQWSDAILECYRENATLAMPKNEVEANVLKNIFEQYPKSTLTGDPNADYLHLGFHDVFSEGEYLTVQGHSIQYFYHTWSAGQPDNANNEDCGMMFRSGLINDYSCGQLVVFICQREANPYEMELSNIINSDIAYKLEPYSRKRFKLHLNPKPWDQARTICHAEGGQLANIGSKQEEDFLVNQIHSPKNKVNHVYSKDFIFMGFHDLFQEGKFFNVQGKELEDNGYVRWASGQPDNFAKNENCGTMLVSGGLNDYPCSIALLFFCELSANSSIDARFRIIDLYSNVLINYGT